MPHTIRNQYDKHLTFEALLEAHNRASKTKRNSKEVLIFEIDLETNLINLYRKLKNGTYKMGKYRQFTIYEPKKRIIQSLPYVDRIVHQWYVYEFIKPYYVPRFIADTYACIDNRGTHKAVDKAQQYMRKMKRKYDSYYILKCDIKGYFYNIDRDILYQILAHSIGDEKILNLTKNLIYDGINEKGLPIGNYTSQYFANIYLNELDHYIKEELKVKYYLRYMDDFVLFVKDKEEAKENYLKIKEYVETKRKLELNDKSRYFPNKMGLDFCGFRIYESHRLLRKRAKQTIKKNIKKWNKFYEHDILDLKTTLLQWNSWIAHSNHANSYHFQKKMYDSILFKEELPFKEEIDNNVSQK